MPVLVRAGVSDTGSAVVMMPSQGQPGRRQGLAGSFTGRLSLGPHSPRPNQTEATASGTVSARLPCLYCPACSATGSATARGSVRLRRSTVSSGAEDRCGFPPPVRRGAGPWAGRR